MSNNVQTGLEPEQLDRELANLLGDDLKARDCEEDIVAALRPHIKTYRVPDTDSPAYVLSYFYYGSNRWQVGSESDWHIYFFYTRYRDSNSLVREAIDHAIAEYRRTPPAYSTTWEGMGKLIEAMNEQGFSCKCVFQPTGGWQFCGFYTTEDDYSSSGFNHKCRFEAVALAAHTALTAQAQQESHAKATTPADFDDFYGDYK